MPSDRLEPTLRGIRISDAEAMCRIANMPGFRRGTLRLPFETVQQWEKRISGAGPEATWIVAEIDGQVVGHGTLLPNGPARRAISARS
ncbi:hypothetical protein [Chelativorans sp. AA-79]|uniref:hypothetical protein n=1 Tax=Chelativorans sp. AA-79 TaxID=3028735 RepID=UPI0023FA4565|nr:hypothetical protein [Chelativorans sp. AA-79]WEX07597.1 hypothetical protein PVE73_15950 [Chelativorans sp. AA-79]